MNKKSDEQVLSEGALEKLEKVYEVYSHLHCGLALPSLVSADKVKIAMVLMWKWFSGYLLYDPQYIEGILAVYDYFLEKVPGHDPEVALDLFKIWMKLYGEQLVPDEIDDSLDRF